MKVIQLKLHHTLLTIVILFQSGFLQSQKYITQQPFYNITTEQGLPSLETYSVKQDSKGYIWICTDAGVCRYDGYKYEKFTTKDGLTDNVVFDIYEDFKGRIWFLTYNSMLCYYENNQFYQYQFNYKISSVLKNEVCLQKDLWIDKSGNLMYELFETGILKISQSGEVTQMVKENKDLIIQSFEGVKTLTRNCSYGFGEAKIDLLSINQNGVKSVIDEYVAVGQFSFPKGKKNLEQNYFIASNKLYDLKSKNVLFQSNGLLELTIRDSVFYISTTHGLLRGKLVGNKLNFLSTILNGHVVSNISFDNEDGVWVSTLDAGVYYCSSILALDETNFKFDKSVVDIVSICKQNSTIIVGNNSGKIVGVDKFVEIDKNFPLNGVVRIVKSDKHLFISNASILDYKLHRCKIGNVYYNWSANLIEKNGIVYLVHGSRVSSYNSLTPDQTIKRIYFGDDDLTLHRQKRLLSITVTDNGKVIVGSKNELFYLNNKKLIPIDLPFSKKVDISSIYHDAFWGLIVGTRGDGLFIFKNKKLIHFKEEDGLLNDHINTLTVGKNGNIFVGTPNGLSMINKNKVIGNLNRNYTMVDVDINVIYCDENEVYLGTKTGLIKLSNQLLNECFRIKNNFKVVLNSTKINQQFVKTERSIQFPTDALHLQLNFSVFQFDNWHNKKYQYKIGDDGQWIDIENPTINLYRPNGSFDVFVRYQDVQNNWSESVLICKVFVLVPFWKRWYFWTLLAFGGLIFFFYLYQRNQKRIFKKLLDENNTLSLEQQMQNARMNPHFIFNVLNSIHSYVLNEETEKADVYLMKFSKLMREILFSTKEGKISIQHETSILNKYLELEQLRFKHSFDFEVIYADEMDDLAIPSMMIQPFVENAVLYSNQIEGAPKMSILVRFEQRSSSLLKVSITNSGIPTLEAQEKMNKSNTKNAIGITRKRLENYNKLFHSADYGIELFVVDEKETRIELKIPIVKK